MMHDLGTKDHPPANAVVMAPREAYDFDYYAQRIADPELLVKSVAVRMVRMPLLAVPVGGTRRGGYFPVPCFCLGLAVRDVLQGQPGFWDLRLGSALYPEGEAVEWGERPPEFPPCPDADADSALGRFYGYSDAAIQQYTAARRARALITPASCSVFSFSPEQPPV
ncbi:DUF6302 family protein [Streptomyces kanamyceticus]|uniref:Uncharacterized protein n=1 Tax=Streptomyces kanamyceticus TaxID=1967 RepID=Q1EQN6_STRKN|nr:DUF6302 family protein [Streptomyces kanamyceticus]QEU90523.1 hypothetical protein CP970_06000 [Streptomyces kanamyceticus]BAE95484.1 hypothetical protein [Streptomyces kanamyceticus]